ncbi:MAG: cytochrome D1 domain-containing protein [Actinomycetota bacterium]
MPRSRIITGGVLGIVIAIAAVVFLVGPDGDGGSTAPSATPSGPSGTDRTPDTGTGPGPDAGSGTEPTTTAPTTTVAHDPARTLAPVRVRAINGAISPKSVVATGKGRVFAQNMMYNHSVTVYDRAGNLVRTIPDGVRLARFGVTGHPGVSQGAPVEAAVDGAGKKMFVSNYAMYGTGHGPEGSDECGGPSGLTPSFVYRIDLARLEIDGVARVGQTPKYVAVTPDDRYVLVTNWCSYDMSVVDHATLREVRRVPLGRFPRGIAVDRASRTAYVAVMGSYDIAKVDLQTFGVSWIRGVGSGPRHLVLSADGSRLYATLNGAGQVVAIDTATDQVVGRVSTGSQPRTMAISADDRALYVVNYSSSTVSVLRRSDLSIVETLPVCGNPIGITYEPVAHRLWVACYGGEIQVFDA